MAEDEIGTFRLVEDNGDCEHRFIVGPQRKIKDLYVGHCDECRQEIALELGKNDERTGRSWIVEYGSAITGNRAMARRVDYGKSTLLRAKAGRASESRDRASKSL